MGSSERGARLLAAAGGDAEHAARIDRTLADLHAEPRPPAPVIQLPSRPYDHAGELELDVDEDVLGGWLLAAAVGFSACLVLAAIAYALYSLVGALS